MTLEALKTLLDETGIPVSYSSVPLDIETQRPYICFSESNAVNFAADGKVYYSRKYIAIKLYTNIRDEVSEGKIETALNNMFWTKQIDYIDNQQIYEITYETEV